MLSRTLICTYFLIVSSKLTSSIVLNVCYMSFNPQSLGQSRLSLHDWMRGHWLIKDSISKWCLQVDIYSLMGGTMSALSLYFEYQANKFEKPKGSVNSCYHY